METVAKVSSPSVKEIFASMEYGPAPESDKVAHSWLEDHNRNFGHFINNQWVHPEGRKSYETKSPATGSVLASTTQVLPCRWRLTDIEFTQTVRVMPRMSTLQWRLQQRPSNRGPS